jgi:hypothetical protein
MASVGNISMITHIDAIGLIKLYQSSTTCLVQVSKISHQLSMRWHTSTSDRPQPQPDLTKPRTSAFTQALQIAMMCTR